MSGARTNGAPTPLRMVDTTDHAALLLVADRRIRRLEFLAEAVESWIETHRGCALESVDVFDIADLFASEAEGLRELGLGDVAIALKARKPGGVKSAAKADKS